MDFKSHDLHMLFFPLMATGHMLPLVDMAKLFAARGARVTILTTPGNAATILATIPNSIHLHTIPFPASEFGLPDNCDTQFNSLSHNLHINFFKALASLRQPFDSVLASIHPDCVISDMFMPWTYHVASARGVPRLVFHGISNFALCVSDAYEKCRELVDEEAESFVIPGLPHRIELFRSKLMDFKILAGTPMEPLMKMMEEMMEVEPKSYGVVLNSFYELEPEYVEYHRKVMGRRTWNVGPVSLCNQDSASKSTRGVEQPTFLSEYLEWLDGKAAGSVVYMCFGSTGVFSVAQKREIALGLEASGHSFVWVVRDDCDDWIPEGYEERIGGRGLVIRGWAPQLVILNHAAVGGFVTHCGWNSSLEGISAGLPMATWSLYADQFYNEKLLVEILKIGVMVGSKVHNLKAEERLLVNADAVEAVVRRLMGEEEEATDRRRRVKELAEKARRAVEKGGSSFDDIDKLMHDLVANRNKPV